MAPRPLIQTSVSVASRSRVLRAGVVLSTVLLGTVAAAYVLPGGSILRRVAEKREANSAPSIKVTGSLVLYGEAAQLAAVPLGQPPERPELQTDAILSVKSPGRCRLELVSPTGQPVAASQTQSKRRFEGPEIQALTVAVQHLCGVLAVRTGSDNDTRGALDRHLGALKVQSKVSSLARFGGQVAYLLGDAAEGAPQFWVYKDIYQPARLLFTDNAGTPWDVRFLDYSSPVTGDGFPRIIELHRAGTPALRFSAVTAETRANLPDKLF
jgi:hypothetical protein